MGLRGAGTTWAIAALALLAVGGIAWWALYPRPSEEDRIRAVVAQMERGFEDKTADRVTGVISQDYGDEFGLRRKDLVFLVLSGLRAKGDFEVEVQESQVAVSGDEATVTLKGEVTLAQGEQEVGRYFGQVTLLLRKEQRDWVLVGSRGWQRRVLRGGWGGF